MGRQTLLVGLLFFGYLCSSPPAIAAEVTASAQTEVWSRLLEFLRVLPGRWAQIGAPRILVSGRHLVDVIETAGPQQRKEALELLSTLARSAPRDRAQVLARLDRHHSWAEVDLWLPIVVANNEQTTNLEEAGLTVEAWLQLAEHLGRRDVLWRAAGVGLYLLRFKLPPTSIVPVLEAWQRLAAKPEDRAGQASVVEAYGAILSLLRRNEEAAAAYRRARTLFAAAGEIEGQANSLQGEANVLVEQGKVKEALQTHRRARVLYEAEGDKLGQANTFQGEATAQLRLGRSDEALGAYEKAVVLCQAMNARLCQSDAIFGSAEVLTQLGRTQDAISAYRQARALCETMDVKLCQANALRGEARALYILGRTDEVMSTFIKAAALYESVGNKLGQANTFLGEAEVLYRLSRNDEALAAYRRASVLYEDSEDSQGQANTLLGEATVLFHLGKNEEALGGYAKAKSLYETVNDKRGQASTLVGWGEVLDRLKRSSEALSRYQQARALFKETRDQLGQANALLSEADLLASMAKHEDALRAYRTARSHYVAGGDKLGQAHTLRGEADLHLMAGRYKDSLRLYAEARALYGVGGDKLGQAYALIGKAEIRKRQRLPCLSLAQQAASLAESSAEAFGAKNAHLQAVSCALDQRDLAAAERHGRKAKQWLTRLRETPVSDQHRTLMSNDSRPADALVPLLALTCRLDEALVEAEDAHAPVLTGLLRSPARGPASTQDAAQTEIATLNQRLLELEKEFQSYNLPKDKERVRSQREALDQQLEDLLNQSLLQQSSSASAMTSLSEAERAQVVSEAGSVLLYYVANKHTYMFLLRPGQRVLLRSVDLSRDGLAVAASRIHASLANSEMVTKEAAVLGKKLLGPFEEELKAQPRVVIIPHGPLHLIPFEILFQSLGGKQPALSSAPSLRALAALQHRRQRSRGKGFLYLRGPVRLPMEDEVVTSIGNFYGSPTPHPVSPTVLDYHRLAGRAEALLVDSHGALKPGSRTGSFIEMAVAPGRHDQRLSALEIARIPLTADLVVLLACDTNRAEALSNDERIDVARAFLIAGARTVLATRWQVPETRETHDFIETFFRQLWTGGSGGRSQRKDEALAAAQLWARERHLPPTIWAAFTVLGDGR